MDYKINKMNWCGYTWKSEMEGGRIIHPKESWMWIDKDQVNILEDGTLELRMTYRPRYVLYEGEEYFPKIACGLIRSQEEFGYGIYSAEIKCPKGYNLWPSFWITGSENWPPEIDIMEAWIGEDNYFRWFTPQFPWLNPGWRTTTNSHYLNKNLEHKQSGSRNISWFKQRKNPGNEFIKYSCKWSPGKIEFFVGNKKTRTRTIKQDITKYLERPDKTWKVNIVFNLFCEDIQNYDVGMYEPMLVKNFKYEEL
jgi:hypothetical protein